MSAANIELRYGLDSFRSDWRHCSMGSNFLAETAFSTPYAKQIASAAINEFLEFAFRFGAKGTKSWVHADVEPAIKLALSLDVRVKEALRVDLLEDMTRFLQDQEQYYLNQLGQDQPGAWFGMSYLACDFACQIKANCSDDLLQLRGLLPLRKVGHE